MTLIIAVIVQSFFLVLVENGSFDSEIRKKFMRQEKS
jgi:hypothetical protein